MSNYDLDLTLDDVLVLYDGRENDTQIIQGGSAITELYPDLDDETIHQRTLKSLLRLNRARLIEINWIKYGDFQQRQIDDSSLTQLLSVEDNWHATSFLVEHLRYRLTERGWQALVSGMHQYRDQLPGYSPGST